MQLAPFHRSSRHAQLHTRHTQKRAIYFVDCMKALSSNKLIQVLRQSLELLKFQVRKAVGEDHCHEMTVRDADRG